MSSLVECLESFNRKERFILLRRTLGPTTFRLDEDFRTELSEKLGVVIPANAYVAMDYHIDWLQMALHVKEGRWDGRPIEAPTSFEANARDIDLLVAFERGATTHVVLLEAKVETNWTNAQLRPKVERLRQIFGDTLPTGIARPHFVLLSRREPRRVDSGYWPRWMKPSGAPQWMELRRPEDLRKVTRCTGDGQTLATGGFLRIDTLAP